MDPRDAADTLAYYTSHGPLTDPGPAASALADLPADFRTPRRCSPG
jgi:hypothetical protein